MPIAKMAPESLQPLLQRLDDARKHTDALFAMIRPDGFYQRPIPERHRLVFYLGHLEAFDWNLMARDTLHHASLHPEYDRLFAFGIDPVDGQLPHDVPGDWPAIEQIRAYNEGVRARIDAALQVPANKLPETIANGTLLHAAIEHRLMHAETLAYLMHQLDYEHKNAPANYETVLKSAAGFTPHLATVPAGVATLGMRRASGQFGWDNEFEENQVSVAKFRISAYPVTNGEFLEFVDAGGYEKEQLWSAEDWAWKNSARISHPQFWKQKGSGWEYRGMFESVALPLDWPVYVSHAEASAYARWGNQSLPTEAQWHRAAFGTPDSECAYPWGDVAPSAERGNFDFARWDPAPVNAHPAGQSAFGAHDLHGNGWEWTATPFAPFAGFAAFPFYPGYSANFFDGKHFVMKGGSQRTAACMLRRSFRNWFQPRYSHVYAKFRTLEE